MNKVILIGNLTREPEMRAARDGVKCCAFGLAVSRRYKNAQGGHDADFFNVTAWRQLGELCQKYLAKGRKVCVEGWIQTRTYEAEDGTRRMAVDIIADNVEFLSPRSQTQDDKGYAGGGQADFAAAGFEQVNCDELPF